jgi:iron(III) transport system substrate-binding protein
MTLNDIGLRGRTLAVAFSLLASSSLLTPPASAEEQVVNVYTTREPGLIQPLFEAFTKETGVKVNAIFVESGIAERVEAEGANSPADVITVVDYGNLIDLVDRGLTQPVQSAVLDAAIPEHLRDPQGHWYALSMRARVIYAAKDLESPPTAYEDLADPEWKGRVCIRSGQHPYNTSLFAAMIAKEGAEQTEQFLQGLKENLARTAGGGDRDVARDIMADICDVGLANSYYVGLMRSGKGGPDQQEWAEAIKVILPTFSDGAGTHVNINGAAIARNAPNRENATKLMEFFVSDDAQKIYAQANFEYPVKEGVEIDPTIAALGDLTIDPLPLVKIAPHRTEASQLVDKVGFDQAM